MDNKILGDFYIKEVERIGENVLRMIFKTPDYLEAYYYIDERSIDFGRGNVCIKIPICDVNKLKTEIDGWFQRFLRENSFNNLTLQELHSNLYSLYLNGEVNKYSEKEKWIGNSLALYFNSNFIRVLFNPFETNEDNRFICQIQSLNLSTGFYDHFGKEDYVTCFNPNFVFNADEWDLLKTTIEDYYMDAVE